MSEGRAALPSQSPPPSPRESTMCVSQPPLSSPPQVRDTDDARTFSATLDAMASRRPTWTTLRGVFKQPASSSRPGLPRRFHTKINLNEYWGVLEKVVNVEVSWSRAAAHAEGAEAAMDVDNEVNENLANERAEQTRMDVDQVAAEEHATLIKDDSPAKENIPVEVIDQVPALPMKHELAAAARWSPSKADAENSPPRRDKARRRSAPASPSTPARCGASPAPSPPRRVPLGTLNGFESRGQLKKSLSPLSAFADNLARRLARQY
ncbi:NADH-quinone oxidoreductase subunit I [Frankliniella fusca]|uniref:NADH-quinone oxidoreductase subunit I n=1 Tax=Frankliniella fusca TaxID=407009 RepID=A0AAE1GYM9_9NEOP|nr:NADH-quinone oxidoreductase subunit I [Frankliniella fusca]